MIGLIVLMLFVVLAAGVFTAATLFEQRRAQGKLLRERLAAVQQAEDRTGPREELALLRDELLSEIPQLNDLLMRVPRINRLQKLLAQADMRTRAGNMVLLCAVCAIVPAWLVFAYTRQLMFAAIVAFAGGALPVLYAMWRRSRRFARFEELLPSAIDLLARAVRAGHSFITGLELIGDEIVEPVGPEFRKLFEEQKFGLPLRDALLNLVDRVPLLDLKFFATAVVLQRETGGNLAEILDNLSYVIRQRFKIRRQVRVYTAQGRLTLAILMALPPCLLAFLTISNPDFVSPLFHDPVGRGMVAAAIVLQIIGCLVIRKIINIKV